MSLSVQISSFVIRVGTEIKTIKSHLGDIAQLSTTATSSLVAAINELKTAVGKNTADIATINDTLTAHGGRLTTVESRATTLEGEMDAVEDALEDLEGIVASQTSIDDANVTATTTYSSSKIVSEITAAKQAVKDDLLGGAGPAYDTLKELADLIGSSTPDNEALEALVAGRVKFDGAQELTDDQKAQARTNIAAASAADHITLAGRVTAVEGVAAQNKSDIAAVDDTNTDYVAIFEAALA